MPGPERSDHRAARNRDAVGPLSELSVTGNIDNTGVTTAPIRGTFSD